MRAIKHLDATDLKAMLSAMDISPDLEAIALSILVRSGMRGQEFVSVRLTDLDLKSNTIAVRAVKGSADRNVPVRAKCLQRLHAALIASRSSNVSDAFGVTDKTIKKVLRIYLQRMLFTVLGQGFSDYGLHSLRATFALSVYEATQDVMLVKELLGHKSINSTMFYVSVSRLKQNKSKVLKALG